MMTLEKPKTTIPTTYVTARTKGGQSKTLTIYNATPEQVLSDFRRFLASQRRRPSARPAAA